MKATLVITITLAILSELCSCAGQPEKPKHSGSITAQTFKSDHGWGYTVFVNDKLFIRQSFIPVVEGNKGFEKEADAIKVATLVVNKIKKHQLPSLALNDLQQCGIVVR